MRDCGDHYEYIAVYCDDLTIASKDPEAISKTLIDVHKFKLKGTGELYRSCLDATTFVISSR